MNKNSRAQNTRSVVRTPVSTTISHKIRGKPEQPLGSEVMPTTVNIPNSQEGFPKCQIGANIGYTINVDNYESVRIDVSATIPTSLPLFKSGKAHDILFATLQGILDYHSDRIVADFKNK